MNIYGLLYDRCLHCDVQQDILAAQRPYDFFPLSLGNHHFLRQRPRCGWTPNEVNGLARQQPRGPGSSSGACSSQDTGMQLCGSFSQRHVTLTCFAMITQQQVGLMHFQLQSIDGCGVMMFRPVQMSFRCLPIFPIGVSFGRLRCQLAAINLLAYGFASKDASRGRFRDSDCSLAPLLFDDV